MIRSYNIHTGLLCIIILLSISGCYSERKQPDRQFFAQVGDNHLTLKQARSEIPALHLQKDSVRALLNYRSKWIRRQLMLQEVKRLDLDRQQTVQKKINQLKQQIYIQALQDYVLRNRKKQLETSREEARDYYQQHKNKFILQERYVRFRHMIADNLRKAEKAKSELLGGVGWKKVAEKYHVNPTRGLNQSDEFKPISMAVPEVPRMQRFLKVIGIKEISPIREENGNYHFVQLTEERPEGQNPDLQWALDHIKDWLKVKKKKEELNAYIKNLYLRARANNEIETANVFDSDTIENRPFNDTTQTPFHD